MMVGRLPTQSQTVKQSNARFQQVVVREAGIAMSYGVLPHPCQLVPFSACSTEMIALDAWNH